MRNLKSDLHKSKVESISYLIASEYLPVSDNDNLASRINSHLPLQPGKVFSAAIIDIDQVPLGRMRASEGGGPRIDRAFFLLYQRDNVNSALVLFVHLRLSLGRVGTVRRHNVGDVFITCRDGLGQGCVENLQEKKRSKSGET